LPLDCTLICRGCFEKLPLGLRRQWQNARNDKAKRACVERVRKFVTAMNMIDAKSLDADFALGQKLMGEST
jgi:hypothetical protein